jgi:hypothetical protein
MALKYPPAPPNNGYRARLCTETDVPAPFLDCVPASIVMMLDVWSQGDIRLKHQDLAHEAAGNRTYPGIAQAAAKLANVEVRFSEAFNTNRTEKVTWDGLLDRLSRGGAASVVGFYSELVGHRSIAGAELIRHDRNLAKSTTVRHAMAVSNFQKAKNRIWLQDPMGKAPFRGEWIRPASLHAFIDKTSRKANARVTAAATPDPDRFPPEGGTLNDLMKSMAPVVNRRAVVRKGATPRRRPAFDGQRPARFKLGAPLAADRVFPLLGFVEGTNLTLADGAVVHVSRRWAALHNARWGIFFVHEQDISDQTRAEH